MVKLKRGRLMQAMQSLFQRASIRFLHVARVEKVREVIPPPVDVVLPRDSAIAVLLRIVTSEGAQEEIMATAVIQPRVAEVHCMRQPRRRQGQAQRNPTVVAKLCVDAMLGGVARNVDERPDNVKHLAMLAVVVA